MSSTKKVLSFRGSLAQDVMVKISQSEGGKTVGEELYRYIRERSGDLVCKPEGDMIVFGKVSDMASWEQ